MDEARLENEYLQAMKEHVASRALREKWRQEVYAKRGDSAKQLALGMIETGPDKWGWATDPSVVPLDTFTTCGTITLPPPETDIAVRVAIAAERSRILAAIQELKPPHRPKANGDWARGWKEAGELAMWERVIAAIGGE